MVGVSPCRPDYPNFEGYLAGLGKAMDFTEETQFVPWRDWLERSQALNGLGSFTVVNLTTQL